MLRAPEIAGLLDTQVRSAYCEAVAEELEDPSKLEDGDLLASLAACLHGQAVLDLLGALGLPASEGCRLAHARVTRILHLCHEKLSVRKADLSAVSAQCSTLREVRDWLSGSTGSSRSLDIALRVARRYAVGCSALRKQRLLQLHRAAILRFRCSDSVITVPSSRIGLIGEMLRVSSRAADELLTEVRSIPVAENAASPSQVAFPSIDDSIKVFGDLLHSATGLRLIGGCLNELLWADGVRAFQLESPDHGVLGAIYLDACTRPDKLPYAWNLDLRRDIFSSSPEFVQSCSVAVLSVRSPDGLTIAEERALFHELAHCVHHLMLRAGGRDVRALDVIAREFPAICFELKVLERRRVADLSAESLVWARRSLRVAVFDLDLEAGGGGAGSYNRAMLSLSKSSQNNCDEVLGWIQLLHPLYRGQCYCYPLGLHVAASFVASVGTWSPRHCELIFPADQQRFDLEVDDALRNSIENTHEILRFTCSV